MDLKELGLSVRVSRLLEREGILTVEELIEQKGELGTIRNFGAKAMKEVEEKLAALKEPPVSSKLPEGPKKSLSKEIEDILADRDRLESELEGSKAKLKALEPLEKFAAIQEEGKKLQKLIPWSRKVTTVLGDFKVEVSPGYLGGYVYVKFWPSQSLVQPQNYDLGTGEHFAEKLSEILEAIHEALRRQMEAEAILKRIGDTRETILSLANLLTYREKSDETQTVT